LEALNQSGYVNGSIMLLQNSFETLFSWLAKEKGKVKILGKNKIENIWASDKIRSLFSEFNVPNNFPPEYGEVFKFFDETKSKDFAYVFTLIRNYFVHYSASSKEEIEKLNGNYWPLLNTGIFYFEILFLRILEYEGKLRSRILKSGYSGERQVSIKNPFKEI
jgi:hypothetical protein